MYLFYYMLRLFCTDMKRFEINHDNFVQDPLIVEVVSNTIEAPSGVLQAVNDIGKVVKL